MSRLTAMLTNAMPITAKLVGIDTTAQETGIGLNGMTSKIKALDTRDALAQEGTSGLINMTSRLQPKTAGSTKEEGQSSNIQTT